ncbi:MAG: GspH/FimT family protein [Moraxellaceae bacterium]|nr:GspH/FimT family protein [Moraxellaceae bacterium]
MSVLRMKGFTLVEVMIVGIIAAIVIGIAAPQFALMQRNARISSYAGELVQAVHEARGRAITSRTNVFLIQGPGASSTDTATVAAGSWVNGWRTIWNDPMTVPAGALVVALRNDRTTTTGTESVRVVVRNEANANINGIGFNRNGRLVSAANADLASASILICAPEVDNERGRVITISLMGRIVNTITANPDC